MFATMAFWTWSPFDCVPIHFIDSLLLSSSQQKKNNCKCAILFDVNSTLIFTQMNANPDRNPIGFFFLYPRWMMCTLQCTHSFVSTTTTTRSKQPLDCFVIWSNHKRFTGVCYSSCRRVALLKTENILWPNIFALSKQTTRKYECISHTKATTTTTITISTAKKEKKRNKTGRQKSFIYLCIRRVCVCLWVRAVFMVYIVIAEMFTSKPAQIWWAQHINENWAHSKSFSVELKFWIIKSILELFTKCTVHFHWKLLSLCL